MAIHLNTFEHNIQNLLLLTFLFQFLCVVSQVFYEIQHRCGKCWLYNGIRQPSFQVDVQKPLECTLVLITQNWSHHPARRAILSPAINTISIHKDAQHKTFSESIIDCWNKKRKANNIHTRSIKLQCGKGQGTSYCKQANTTCTQTLDTDTVITSKAS
jgi:hypothetical protein